jgi:hypothetical protein
MRRFLIAAAALCVAVPLHAAEYRCAAPTVFLGDTPDGNPVVETDISFTPSLHAWQVFHHHQNGMVAARAQQYAIEDWSNPRLARWGGSLNRNRSLYMVGTLGPDYYYRERLYDRAKGNALVVDIGSQCELVHTAAVVPVPVVPERVYVPVAPNPSMLPVPAPRNIGIAEQPVQQTGPTQQNGPVVVAPPSSNNITITVVPGTSYTPQPREEPKSGS